MNTFQILERLKPSEKKEIKEIKQELSLAESVLARLNKKKPIKENVIEQKEVAKVETLAEEERTIKHLEEEIKELREQMKQLLVSHRKMLIHEGGFDE